MSERIRVMVVDDHQMFAEGIVRALSDEPDVEVTGTSSTVAEAVAMARLHRPDVVLMDYELPDGDGAAATQRIKDETPDTKVVMVTSHTEESVLLASIEAGCSGFITKTKVVAEVVQAIRAAHAGEALISPSMLARLLPKLRRDYRGVGSDLTKREIEILRLLADGKSNQAIADALTLSLHTVRNHVQNIITKLHAHSKLEAVAAAARQGIIRYS